MKTSHHPSLTHLLTTCPVHELFPPELRPYLGNDSDKKKRVLTVATKMSDKSTIQQKIEQEEGRTREAELKADDEDDEFDEEEVDEEEEKERDDDDNSSAVSSDSEEADDDYNAEQYFDNGEEDDIDDADPYENTYE